MTLGACSAPDPTPERRRWRRIVARALCASIAMVLGALILELALRMHHGSFETPAISVAVAADSSSSWHIRDARLGHRHASSRVARAEPPIFARTFEVRLNSEGLREDREFTPIPEPGVERIVALGDSYTFGFCVDGRDAFPKVLERRLGPRHEVLNFGVTGFGVDQMRLLLDEALVRRPRIVLLCFIHDDMLRPLRACSDPALARPTYVLDDGALVLVEPGDPRRASARARMPLTAPAHAPFGSYLAWRVRNGAVRIRSVVTGDPHGNEAVLLLARALMLDAARAAKECGATLVAVLLPTPGFEDADPLRRLLPSLEAEGIPTLDGYASYRAWRESHGDRDLFVKGDGHPDEEGHRVLGDALAALLRERHLVR